MHESPPHPSPRESAGSGAVPALDPNATAAQREAHWYAHVYQGDRTPQLTLRALLIGAVIGTFMAAANLYTTLKLGWSFGVAVTAVVLSYVMWNAMRILSGGRLTQLSILENNCMASCASAAGYSTGSTVGVAFAALLLLQGHHQPPLLLGAYVLFTAGLGVFLAIPLKRQMINHEQLPFPTGTAAAETLRSLYSAGAEAMHKAYSLVAALAFSLGLGFLRTYATLVDQLVSLGKCPAWLERLRAWCVVPESIAFSGFLNPLARGSLAGLAFEPSVLLMGAGMLMGARVSLSMLAGSLLLYYVVAPAMLAHDLAQTGVAGYVPAFRLRSDGSFNPVSWALWGGTSLMVMSSLTALALDWRTIARAFTGLRASRTAGSGRKSVEDIEVPVSWLILGGIPFALGTMLVLWIAFQVALPLGLIAVLLTGVVALVSCRATGETDTTPVGPMGKITQLLFAVLPGAAGNTAINLVTAGASASAGMSAADLLTDLKSGYLLGANPRRQFLAQFTGIFVGTLAIIPAWYLMVPTKERLEAFNPPAANMWKAVADLLTQGFSALPTTTPTLMAIGACLGIALPLAQRFLPALRPFLPSAMGLGFSWAFVFQNSLSFAIGGVLVWTWSRWRSRQADLFSTPVASGFIAGESLIAAAIAIACTLAGLAFS
ncbi:MAG: OPT/YSL family transporter [Verrucomicrobiales bacterium]|nr:OPT/YSL family transporter [Verrucomicrobiales bacterium]